MMADNIEHVISYKVMFDRFHSPALGGFAVVSHWVPFLLLAGVSGGLADRFDIRRLIQLGMMMYIAVSVSWGVMFLTNTVTLGRAMTLLVIHGLAGVIWVPAGQVLIHQLVPQDQLASAVRLNATGRYLGFLVGPVLGAGVLMALLGPAYGILLNTLFYLPLVLWLVNAPYGPRYRKGAPPPRAVRRRCTAGRRRRGCEPRREIRRAHSARPDVRCRRRARAAHSRPPRSRCAREPRGVVRDPRPR